MDLSRAADAPSTLERPRIDPDTGTLLGSRCNTCGTSSWPARAVCHHCGSADVDGAALSREGSLITYTTVWVPRPGVEPPYALGQIDLPEGVRVVAHVREVPEGAMVPLPVHIVMAADADAIPPFWFQPTEA